MINQAVEGRQLLKLKLALGGGLRESKAIVKRCQTDQVQ